MASRPQKLDISLDALRIPTQGKSYDLCSGWWPGMPLAEGHPQFQVLTYRSPRGQRNQKDLGFLRHNTVNFGFISELLMCTTHTGTHIDALSHVTCGPHSEWHGGYRADECLGDFGPMCQDAAALPPFICRGVMLDIPAALDMERLDAHQPIGPAELEKACKHRGISLRSGDVVLIRTGTMDGWPDQELISRAEGSGLNLEGAQWLMQFEPAAVGADNVVLEVSPSGIDGDPQPVHRYLLQQHGIPILEWVYQEELARDGVSQFLFLCLPLPISGATGSMIRPLAIV
ncbi:MULTISPECIES: cyclase family protein [unclassified Rhizobium]|uniref:cyclase family protein n=1 Tax=unclassified Rhizobium TaxID=2613769 RepID=UPI001ADCE6C4|nr:MULTISPECIES: cyclase family protein [unclassified Rhizobium]MBO9127891.1 cyclase family protein [Rhizobium sp. 16-488-2b]MBO9178285.1 cyclase family protein [Rhizobium sp. 16-488-2a]